MVLKRPFISDTGEDIALYIHCLGLPEDNFNWYKFCWKDGIEMLFVSDNREDLALYVHVLHLLEDGAFS